MKHFTLLIFGALLGTGMSRSTHAAEMFTLRYGQNSTSAASLSSLPLNVAERKGFFSREGLVLEVIPIPGGKDRIVAALDKGEIDAGKNATPYLIQAVLKGSDAVAIIAQTTNPVYSLIVRSEIKSFADLKGKTVGLSTAGDTITLSALRLLAKGHRPCRFSRQGRSRHECALRLSQVGGMRGRADGSAGRSRRDQTRLSAFELHL